MERISLESVAFEGDNNVYLHNGEETVLIDTGVSTAENRRQLHEALDVHNLTLADIDVVLLTHWHQDHAGMAGEIQRKSGATVYAHKKDADLIQPQSLSVYRDYMDTLATWGIPADTREELVSFIEAHDHHTGKSVDVKTFEHGASFSLGSLELEAIHSPGHTAGLTSFTFTNDGHRGIVTGDALLPVYTPNVGGADIRVEGPLEQYVNTLQRFIYGGFDVGYPGHRSPITDVAERGREILSHHEERAWNVLSVLDRIGPADAWTVSGELFGDVEGIHVLHGPGEAFAHLDHLRREDFLECVNGEYRLIKPDWKTATDGDRLPLTED
jgi:glyoxylase-like metal-dependent hydrolase (beta-lactamase superfamily II)